MSEQSPRRPANLPTGASSLSDRIAALQRKSSSNAGSPRSTSANVVGSGAGSQESSLPGASAVARSVSSSAARSQAVKDRMMRFQNDEKPLIPKSSFGAPTPMNADRHSNAVRPYPGANASGSGSGKWGENVLRPQVTGGTWASRGEGKGWADGASVRPQMTGSPWLGVGGGNSALSPANAMRTQTSPKPRLGSQSPSGSFSRSPIRQRDAFLDLEEDPSRSTTPTRMVPLRRGSSFTEAQMAAASTGLANVSRRPSAEDPGKESNTATEDSLRKETITSSGLPDLPDAPSKIEGLLRVPSTREANAMTSHGDAQIPALPTPPTETPVTSEAMPPRDVRTSGDIEIGVGGASPARLAQLRRSLSGTQGEEEPSGRKSPVAGSIPNPPKPFLEELLMAHRSENSASSANDNGSFKEVITLPESDKETENDRIEGEKTMGEGKPEEPKSQAESELKDIEGGISSTAIVDEIPATTAEDATPQMAVHGTLAKGRDASLDTVLESNDQQAQQNHRTSVSATHDAVPVPLNEQHLNGSSRNSDSALTASTAAAVEAPPPLPPAPAVAMAAAPLDSQASSSNAERRAREAVQLARNKSQRIRKPPIGRPMTAAEMEASDDEYEPGWASVLSATSSRT